VSLEPEVAAPEAPAAAEVAGLEPELQDAEPAPEPAVDPEPFDYFGPEAPAVLADPPAAEDEDGDETAASVAPPALAPVRSPLPERAAITKPGPWLRDALTALAVDEPDIAELLMVALLPAQGGTVKRLIAYDLAIEGGATHRVAVGPDRARIELPGQSVCDARVSGSLTALVPLAAGGAARRLPGTEIQGRRRLRRLLKARRAPLGLAQLAAAGVAPSPGLLLTALARAVPADWTEDRPLTLDVAAQGADRWRIIASGRGPLTILPADLEDRAPATLHTTVSLLPAVLAGTAQAGDAWVEGDVKPVRTLLSWFDRAQRGER
jgi:hypothetical protein